MDYDIIEIPTYKINCENCDEHYFSTTIESLEARVKNLGWIAVNTPEDGTLNFCPDCKEGAKS